MRVPVQSAPSDSHLSGTHRYRNDPKTHHPTYQTTSMALGHPSR